jgi:predicted ferric reductase
MRHVISQHLSGIRLEDPLDLDRASLRIHQVSSLLSFLLLLLHQPYAKLSQNYKNLLAKTEDKYLKIKMSDEMFGGSTVSYTTSGIVNVLYRHFKTA